MDASKYNRSIALMCPTCGHKSFEHDENDLSTMRCVGCDRIFAREELIRENGELIEAEATAVKAAIVRDLKKELHDSLKQAFRNSKHIRFK